MDMLKNSLIGKVLLVTTFIAVGLQGHAQNAENWAREQLLEPFVLANDIKGEKELPLIISVGPAALIPNSIAIGMVNNPEGLAKLKATLKELPKNQKVVVYCGCCPFAHCPDVRPAMSALKEYKFTDYYLLNLPHNIKQDWIDKGYPVSKQ